MPLRTPCCDHDHQTKRPSPSQPRVAFSSPLVLVFSEVAAAQQPRYLGSASTLPRATGSMPPGHRTTSGASPAPMPSVPSTPPRRRRAKEVTRSIEDLCWHECPVGSILSVRAGMPSPAAAAAEAPWPSAPSPLAPRSALPRRAWSAPPRPWRRLCPPRLGGSVPGRAKRRPHV
ncbi:hypothetical protein SORBI_3006G253050 [Sorghum bicolor]|uniref:Uncharacterized protein n=1 Tax=Sorghum bicolor TaxID=4558 RepID=A0A1Z5RFN0_SORBI|nr:hypothetical protein SORBI_3006G253050 [Sorghum bicolor]